MRNFFHLFLSPKREIKTFGNILKNVNYGFVHRKAFFFACLTLLDVFIQISSPNSLDKYNFYSETFIFISRKIFEKQLRKFFVTFFYRPK